MKHLTREKTALLVFALILIMALGALVAYVVLGHSWNLVASKVDDAASDMEGYAVILYEGTETPSARSGDFNEDPPVSLASACTRYREKSASVVSLDMVDPEVYRSPEIFKAGDSLIGVVYLPAPASKAKDTVAEVRELAKSCDCVLAIAPSSYIASTYDHIDIAIDMNTVGEKAMKKTKCTMVSNADIGYVGAILVSPSGVVSSHEVRSL